MSTYDGTELRDAIRARLNQRWDDARAEVFGAAGELMAKAIKLDDSYEDEIAGLYIGLSSDPAVAAMLDTQADKLGAKAVTASIKAQMDEVLP